ncbi:MAG: ABC transporter ATP-binding protein [Clostridium sp.]|uniref:ABC transporter ATP-binding protein n=1 Tax=Clostridium sp. TaxID=1506 RepID=UPI0029149243|nr:ABC transporter ATP-binding protein [Clostridium sp.]MDU7337787.1 ABC transporter ATP-binding protein [Clostridium sp.]
MRELTKYLKSYRKQVILGPIFKLIEAIFELIIPIVTARIIDQGVLRADVPYVWKMGGVMLLLGVVGLCSTLVCQKMAAEASQGFGTVLRGELFRHINTLSYAEIDRFGTPSLITRLTNDVNQLQLAVAMLIRLVVRAPFLAIGAVIMAMTIDVPLAIIFVVATPLIGLALYLVMSRSIPFFKSIQKKLDVISRLSRESLSGVRVIRAFSRQKQETERFTDAAEEQAAVAIRVGKLSALLNPITFSIVNFSILAIVWFGGYRVDNGVVSQGQIVALINYMNQTFLALVVVANLVVIFTKASASASRVNEVLQTETAVRETTRSEEVKTIPGAPKVEFCNVSFSYHQSGEYAIKDCNIAIAPGETIGIIGGTGSGKSTFVNLIPRFYDVTEGQVLLDGVDVREYPFQILRNRVGIVLQQSELFTGTIGTNLKWGNANATDDELWLALKTAQAEEFVRALPKGLSSPVSQGGKNYSGGQRQRLAIARTLAKNPQVLILDDSSSALDFATDAALRRALKNDTAEMTVLIVSQRVSSIRHADRIMVLDDGAVAGIGTHEELVQGCPVYQEICLSQMNREEVAK